MAIENYYSTLTLTQVTATINEYGQEIDTEIEVEVQGLINQAGTAEVEYANARNIDITHHCYLEVTATTKTINKQDYINGMEVKSSPKNTVGRNHHLKILLREVV